MSQVHTYITSQFNGACYYYISSHCKQIIKVLQTTYFGPNANKSAQRRNSYFKGTNAVYIQRNGKEYI